MCGPVEPARRRVDEPATPPGGRSATWPLEVSSATRSTAVSSVCASESCGDRLADDCDERLRALERKLHSATRRLRRSARAAPAAERHEPGELRLRVRVPCRTRAGEPRRRLPEWNRVHHATRRPPTGAGARRSSSARRTALGSLDRSGARRAEPLGRRATSGRLRRRSARECAPAHSAASTATRTICSAASASSAPAASASPSSSSWLSVESSGCWPFVPLVDPERQREVRRGGTGERLLVRPEGQPRAVELERAEDLALRRRPGRTARSGAPRPSGGASHGRRRRRISRSVLEVELLGRRDLLERHLRSLQLGSEAADPSERRGRPGRPVGRDSRATTSSAPVPRATARARARSPRSAEAPRTSSSAAAANAVSALPAASVGGVDLGRGIREPAPSPPLSRPVPRVGACVGSGCSIRPEPQQSRLAWPHPHLVGPIWDEPPLEDSGRPPLDPHAIQRRLRQERAKRHARTTIGTSSGSPGCASSPSSAS